VEETLASVTSLRVAVQGHKWGIIGVYIYIYHSNVFEVYNFMSSPGSPA
jgi:hypothetical protein